MLKLDWLTGAAFSWYAVAMTGKYAYYYTTRNAKDYTTCQKNTIPLVKVHMVSGEPGGTLVARCILNAAV